MGEIQLLNLRKEYGSTVAVAETTLTIYEGEFLVMVGPSGCGKTTTLRMIAGLEEPTSGTIEIDGQVANDLEPGQRNLGMVFQNLALFPHMSVFNNIAFGPRMKKVDPETRRRWVEKVAQMVRIHHLLGKMPGQLSGGEAQRVALARTLITDPRVFLLDEPLSNLDAKLRKEMRAEIDRLHGTLGKTFIYVTHDQEEAMTLADRIVVMRDGWIEQVGSPLEIYHNPINRFVAGFFGSPAMNLLEGELKRRDGRLHFLAPGLEVPLEGLEGSWAGPVTLGVRPEHIGIDPAGGDYRAEVSLVEPLGKETLLYLEYGGPDLLVAVVDGGFSAQERGSIAFRFNPEKIYLFDAEGKRIR